jgi:hypothetical protein
MEALIGIIALICAIWVIYDVWAVNKGLSTGAKVLGQYSPSFSASSLQSSIISCKKDR